MFPFRYLSPPSFPAHPSTRDLQFRFEDYAESFFLTQKRGKIFKRQIPVDEMLQFSPDQLPGPLLNLPTKQLKKEALQASRCVSARAVWGPCVGVVCASRVWGLCASRVWVSLHRRQSVNTRFSFCRPPPDPTSPLSCWAQNFKLVQMYMGDQSSSKDPLDIASGIIRNGALLLLFGGCSGVAVAVWLLPASFNHRVHDSGAMISLKIIGSGVHPLHVVARAPARTYTHSHTLFTRHHTAPQTAHLSRHHSPGVAG